MRSAVVRRSIADMTAGTTLAFAATFLWRWLTIDFPNDHFTHLSRARQIVLGEWPIRDFFDPGQLLHYGLSATALALFGDSLFGEALLTIGFIALSAALAFALATRVTGSRTLGAGATVFAVGAFPRLYNYPKVFLYVAALWLMWWYAHHPSRGRIVMLAVFCAVAFLFRYDHGAYIALGLLVLLTLVHASRPREWLTAVALFGGTLFLLLIPFGVYVQWATGLRAYVASSRLSVRLVRRASRPVGAPLHIDLAAPLFVVHPFAPEHVVIRWTAAASDEQRGSVETRYRLIDPVPIAENVWRYGLTDVGVESLRGLIAEKAIGDLSGVDINRIEPSGVRRLLQPVDRRVPLLRMSLAPGVFTDQNALACFYAVTIGLPVIALFMSLTLWLTGGIIKAEATAIVAMAGLCLVISHTLVGSDPATRLPDVASPIAILGAWVARRWFVWMEPWSRGWRTVGRFALAILAGVALWSVGASARTMKTVQESRALDGPAATWSRLTSLNTFLHRRPVDAWAPPEKDTTGIRRLARYVWRCTRPSDRLLVTSTFSPEVFFYAERGFAGGQVHFMRPWHASAADQELTVQRIGHQSVPIVLEGPRPAPFNSSFPRVASYIGERYVEAARSTFGGEDMWRVLVDAKRTPTSVDPELGLPCFAER